MPSLIASGSEDGLDSARRNEPDDGKAAVAPRSKLWLPRPGCASRGVFDVATKNAGAGDAEMEDPPEDIPFPADFDSDDENYGLVGMAPLEPGNHLGPQGNDDVADVGLEDEVETLGAADLPGKLMRSQA